MIATDEVQQSKMRDLLSRMAKLVEVAEDAAKAGDDLSHTIALRGIAKLIVRARRLTRLEHTDG